MYKNKKEKVPFLSLIILFPMNSNVSCVLTDKPVKFLFLELSSYNLSTSLIYTLAID